MKLTVNIPYNYFLVGAYTPILQFPDEKSKSIGPVLIWPNITIDVNVVFQEILHLKRVRNIKRQ